MSAEVTHHKASSGPAFLAAEVAEQLQTRGTLVHADLVFCQVALFFDGRRGRTIVALDVESSSWRLRSTLVRVKPQEVPRDADRLGEGAFANVALRTKDDSRLRNWFQAGFPHVEQPGHRVGDSNLEGFLKHTRNEIRQVERVPRIINPPISPQGPYFFQPLNNEEIFESIIS